MCETGHCCGGLAGSVPVFSALLRVDLQRCVVQASVGGACIDAVKMKSVSDF